MHGSAVDIALGDFLKQLDGRTCKPLDDSKVNPPGKLDTDEVQHYDC